MPRLRRTRHLPCLCLLCLLPAGCAQPASEVRNPPPAAPAVDSAIQQVAYERPGAPAAASAAGDDLADTRLQLTEAARNAFADYYLAGRALAVNEEGLNLLREFRRNAETLNKYGKAPQQDLLQADVEIGRQQERQV